MGGRRIVGCLFTSPQKIKKDIDNLKEIKHSRNELGEIVFQELLHPVDIVQAEDYCLLILDLIIPPQNPFQLL